MSTNSVIHVLIIGGGMAGLSLAAFLQKASHHPLSKRQLTFTIFELHTYEDAVPGPPGGFGVAPNGVAVFDSLGIVDELIEKAGICTGMTFLSEGGTKLGQFKIDQAEYEFPLLCIMRDDLQDSLRKYIKENGDGKIEYAKKLVAMEDLEDKVVAHFADGTSVSGDILIGADGIHSQTRRCCFPDSPSPEFVGLIGLGGGVLKPSLPPSLPSHLHSTMTLTFGRKAFFGTFPMKNGTLGWWSNYTSPNPLPQSQLRDTSDVISTALSKHHHFPATELIQNSAVLIKTNIFDIQSLPIWYTKNRVLLIGDAAHAVSPNSGQGLSLAVEDSSLLALLLSRTECSLKEVFVKFEEMRKGRVEKIIAVGRKQKDNKVEVGVVGGWLRNFVLWVGMGLFSLFGSLERLIGWQYRYRIDWDVEDVERSITTYKK